MVKKRAVSSMPVRGSAKGPLEAIGKQRWHAMRRIADAIRALGTESLTRVRAAQLARELDVDASSVYRYRARLAQSNELTAVAGRKRGWKPTGSRLSADQELAIEQGLKALGKKPGLVRVVDLVEEVGVRCRVLRVPCPSRPAIERRLERAGGLKVQRRGVALPGSADPRISPGTHAVKHPLDVVQIDHTTMDIVVVDDLYRRPLGQPYLTLATDVASRCILGFVISFAAPSAATVSLCMTLVVASKDPWLRELGIEGAWPMAGLPKVLHLDGAAEFKSKALRRGCAQYGIKLTYRERVHHGGHIERVLGTKMNKLKGLPGATGGTPKSRRDYEPDKHAALTLRELEIWLARQIVTRYHHDAHRGLLGGTPSGAWELRPATALAPDTLRRFRIAFLPAVTRTLRRSGLVFHHLRYWHPVFSQWLGRRRTLVVHYDPRNLSKLYIPHGDDYLEACYADLRQPPVSLWEAVAASRHLRSSGQNTANPSVLIQAIEKQRELISTAQASTRKLRRGPRARPIEKANAMDPLNQAKDKDPGEAVEIDWSTPAKPYGGEIW